MATQREIRKRIQSVSSTKKITKTMEMISTSKMKKMQGRLLKSKPYEIKLEKIIYSLMESGIAFSNEELVKERSGANKSLIVMITGNRGLCGGFNTNIINNTISFKEKLEEDEKKTLFYIIGKKGINYFKFIDIDIMKAQENLEDKITYKDVENLGEEIIDLFKKGEVDEVFISYTKVISSAGYKPDIYRLLPLSIEQIIGEISKEERKELQTRYIFEPDPARIFTSLLPLYIKNKVYSSFLESGYSEQNARRIAMKNATDAAGDMVKELTVKYNRARQAKITNEIAEIVGGAAALE